MPQRLTELLMLSKLLNESGGGTKLESRVSSLEVKVSTIERLGRLLIWCMVALATGQSDNAAELLLTILKAKTP